MTVHVKWTREGWGGGEGRVAVHVKWTREGWGGGEERGRLGRRGGKGNRRWLYM